MKAKDLKNSILQMAIEGKLVPQDPNDEPASVLLERIREEKHKLIAEGKAKFPKGGESVIYIGSDGSPYEKRVDAKGCVLSDKCIADEVPFGELPEGWAWTRFQTACLGSFTGPFGSALHKSDYVDNGIPVINPANIRDGLILPVKMVSEDTHKRLSNYVLHSGDFIIGRRGEMGRAAIVTAEEDGWLCGTGCFFAHTTSVIERSFWKLYFASSTVINQLEMRAVGTTMKNLNLTILDSLLLPLPPLAEQRRIVEYINELIPLVEEYGALEDAREALEAVLPGRLRKSVLQLAVRGGLAPQDPADEPAGVLLERIRGQRRQLVAEGKMKAPRGGESVIFAGSDGRRYEKRVDARGRESDPVCIEDEIPFEIPEGWEWARLESICELVRGSGIKRSDIAVEGLPCVRYGELYTTYETSITTVASYTSEAVFNVSKKIEPGEVLITLTGENNIDIGRAVFNATEDTLAFGGDLLALKGQNIRGDYLVAAINSSAVGSQRTRASTGNIIVHLSAAKACRFLIPVPPLQEQGRIVELINEFVALVTS